MVRITGSVKDENSLSSPTGRTLKFGGPAYQREKREANERHRKQGAHKDRAESQQYSEKRAPAFEQTIPRLEVSESRFPNVPHLQPCPLQVLTVTTEPPFQQNLELPGSLLLFCQARR